MSTSSVTPGASGVPARAVEVIDSHTGGEPTRVVISGGPDLGDGPLDERVRRFRETQDRFRSAIVNEPRGSDVVVGALLCEPFDKSCGLGVIFFNNVGYLGMCGHGTIGLVATLGWMGRLAPGEHRIDTPVGPVTATLHPDGAVSVANVASYRKAAGVTVTTRRFGQVTGDVAWGGNWFYLVEHQEPWLELQHVEELTELSWEIRQAVNEQGYPEVDHVELYTHFHGAEVRANARNFVLCPGKAYDRSPCGTGTSAKLACLAADGRLAPGELWIQESVLGSRFTGRYTWIDREAGRIAPVITGSAFVNARATLILDESDPFCWGIRSQPVG